jgi:oxygen-dependent protoporphyrinogen oxidase
MAAGVFAGDPQRLSVEATFPALVELERAHGSVIKGAMRRRSQTSGDERTRTHIPKGGMSVMIDSLADALGDRFRPSFAVESVRREGQRWIVEGPERLTADVVVLAVPPMAAAGLVERVLGDVLRKSVAAPVTVVFLGGTGPSPMPQGFGALIGPKEGLSTRGILFESSYAPDRAAEGSWLAKLIVGGATEASAVDHDGDRLIPDVVAEVETVLVKQLNPNFVELVKHRPGIPQYEVGHRRWLSEIDGLLAAAPWLHLTGWGYRGVGVANLATDAVRVADAVTRS